MLAAPKLKLFYRCGESESARWISDTIGEYEVEKPRIGTTASVDDRGRDALNYSTMTEHRQAISKEEIMALPDLHGYWKYGDAVVPFRLPLAHVKIVARGFIRRELLREMHPEKLLGDSPLDQHEADNTDSAPCPEPDPRRYEQALTDDETKTANASDVASIEAVQPVQFEVPANETDVEESAEVSSAQTDDVGY